MAALATPRLLAPESGGAPPESCEVLPESGEAAPESGELAPESGAVFGGGETVAGALGAGPPPGGPLGEPFELDPPGGVPPSGAPPHAMSIAKPEAAAREKQRERLIETSTEHRSCHAGRRAFATISRATAVETRERPRAWTEGASYRDRGGDKVAYQRTTATSMLVCPSRLLAPSLLVLLAASAACTATTSGDVGTTQSATSTAAVFPDVMGARYDATGTQVRFRVHSPRATRLVVDLYAQSSGADEVLSVPMALEPGSDVWAATVHASTLKSAGLEGVTVSYGYRAWGPNWPFDATWTKGSSAGFVSDVDASGNRFNPNKLLLDPFALETSHDPLEPSMLDGSVYMTGVHRTADSGKVAPKGYVLGAATTSTGTRPTRALKDDVVYEVHVRGLTKQDPTVPSSLQGTYAGAAMKAGYLANLGVTAVELLPIHESQNDTNDIAESTNGANYWGYATLDFFAPDRRYASDRSPGGPTREFQSMVSAFHARGIKVFLDVVYNHTAEGGTSATDPTTAKLLSMRGLDNPDYYELTTNGQYSFDSTGTGGNFNTATSLGRTFILDSLSYWKNTMGVDGFRFDLAPVLGNTCTAGCFNFNANDPDGVLSRAPLLLPARPATGGDGVDLIAEPWAVGAGTYQLGSFPSGWSEWNGNFRDTMRTEQNKLGVIAQSPNQVIQRATGSSDLFSTRGPAASVNFMDVHDGFTLHDLYAYDVKQNAQPWPYGPSSGGNNSNLSWDQGGNAALQAQAARTGLALVMVSFGVPLVAGGDEMLRTINGNNNPYNLDSDKNWLDWSRLASNASFFTFAQRLIALRAAHPALRPGAFLTASSLMLLDETGQLAQEASLNDDKNAFMAWRIAGGSFDDSARAIYIAYNAGASPVAATLPGLYPGMSWYRACDTSAAESCAPTGLEGKVSTSDYTVEARSVLVLLEHD
jgi:isoamylase